MPDEYADAIGKIDKIDKRQTGDSVMEIDLSLAGSEEMPIFENGDYQEAVGKIDKITAKIMEKEQKGKTIFGYMQREHEAVEGTPEKNADLAKDIYRRLVAPGLRLDVPAKKIKGSRGNVQAVSAPGAAQEIPKAPKTHPKLPDNLGTDIRKSIADLEGRIGRRAGILNRIEKAGKRRNEGSEDMPVIDQIEMLNNIINNVRSGNAGNEALQEYRQKVQRIRKSAGEGGGEAGIGTYMITVRNDKIKEAEDILGIGMPLQRQ
jgi:hypothetical protein